MLKNENEMYEKINQEEEKEDIIFGLTLNKNTKRKNKKIKKNLIKDNIIKDKKYIRLIIIIFFITIFSFLILIETFSSQQKTIINKTIKNLINQTNSQINNNNITKINDNKKEEEDKINIIEKEKDKKSDKEDNKEKEKEKDKKDNKEKEKEKEDIKETDNTEKQKIKEEEDEEKEEKEEEQIKPKDEDIYRRESFDGFESSFRKARPFLESNMKGEILHKEPFIKSKSPKVSAVIPIYNAQDVILRAVRSIQNQNMLNIEIILVNDFSTDNTLSLLEQFEKEDPRIQLIKNKKNMGILYSRSIGSLAAKGKYIFPLDNDDMFLDKDVFQTITERAEKGNFDIIEFRGVLTLPSKDDLFNRRRIGTTFSPYGDNYVVFQPRLGSFPYQRGSRYGEYRLISVYLWSKCIKTKIYKKALKAFGKERYSRYMLRDEDFLVNFIIFNFAKSYKFLGKYGIAHIQRFKSASVQPDDVQQNKQNIYVLEAALDFSQNITSHKEWIAYYTTYILQRNKLEETLKDPYINKMFLTSLDRIFNSQGKYFADKDKQEIKRRVMEKKYIDFKF